MVVEILGLVFSIIIGTIGHFLYDFSNKNKYVGFWFSKDESVIEHIKLGVTPILLWTIVELFTNYSANLFFSKFISILIFITSLLVLYYGYKFIIKKNILFLDIFIFYISLTLAYFVSINLLLYVNINLFLNVISLFGLVAIILSYKIVN